MRMYVLRLHVIAQLNITNTLIKLKPDTKEFLMFDFIYIKLKKQAKINLCCEKLR